MRKLTKSGTNTAVNITAYKMIIWSFWRTRQIFVLFPHIIFIMDNAWYFNFDKFKTNQVLAHVNSKAAG